MARFRVELRSFLSRTRYLFISSRTPPLRYEDRQPRRILSAAPSADSITKDFAHLSLVNDLALRHEFNLLGSGWVQVRRGMSCAGVEGHVYQAKNVRPPESINDVRWLKSATSLLNRSASLDAWMMIEKRSYQPIDWHIDFKSGFRWAAGQWWRRVPYGHLPGIDIKVPWELARMQHLPGFALEAELLKSSNRERALKLQSECRSQILDFIAQNAPLFGVNWRCAMDVGIRAANWILAVDLFRASGFEFDQHFYETFLASLEDHGKFITGNFEKYPDFRANHYLANICGLAFIAVALPKDSTCRKVWLEISQTELLAELEYQFHREGTNFEASTSYHRLSGEMGAFTVALFQGEGVQSKKPFLLPEDLLYRLKGIGMFSDAIRTANDGVVQIGDTDSGRFFKVPARYEMRDRHLEENDLNQIDLGFATRALFQKNGSSLTADIVQSLARQTPLRAVEKAPDAGRTESKTQPVLSSYLEAYDKAAFKRQYRFDVPLPLQTVEKATFPEFGLTLYRSGPVFLSFRCGPLGQYGRAGHDHDDQLSIEIDVAGNKLVADPGTYLYTALPQRRNEYRSIQAHFAPQFENAQAADLDAGLFYLRQVHPGEILFEDARVIVGSCLRRTGLVFRMITFEENQIRVQDWSNDSALLDLTTVTPLPYSSGYGRK